jgi:hypothetical protein
MEAMSQDEKLAEQLAARPEPGNRPATRRMSDWSATVELLTAILNRLGELTQAVAALGGAKPRTVPSAPVPATAIDRVRNRKRFERHNTLAARVLRRPSTPDVNDTGS